MSKLSTYILLVVFLVFVITSLGAPILHAQDVIIRWPARDGSWPSAWIDLNNDGRPEYGIDLNPWRLNSARGNMQMRFFKSNRSLEVTVSLRGVSPIAAVNGYPEIFVGRKPWSREYANGLGVNFPIGVSTLMSRNLLVSFSICVTHVHPFTRFNIATDAWLVRPHIANSPGSSPGEGDVEIMIWIYRQHMNPAGRKEDEVTIQGRRWEVWIDNGSSRNGVQYIAFVPKGWSIRCGNVSFNVSEFIREARRFTNVSISNLYLLGWEVGTEWSTFSIPFLNNFINIDNFINIAEFRWYLTNFNVSLS